MKVLFTLSIIFLISQGELASADAGEIEMALVGDYDKHKVPKEPDGSWWAVCGKSSLEIKKVSISSKEKYDPQRQGMVVELSQNQCERVQFMLRGDVPWAEPGSIEMGHVKILNEVRTEITFKNKSYAIENVWPNKEGYLLEISDGKMKQAIFSTDVSPGLNSRGWYVLFSGDVNRDGKLDIFLYANDGPHILKYKLLLSNPTNDKIFVRNAATMKVETGH